MATASQSAVISTRLPSDVKAQFGALAAQFGLTESGLMAKLVDEVLRANTPVPPTGSAASDVQPEVATGADVADRLTVRLRPGDRARAARRADARGMKTGSYLTLLVHNHVHTSDVLPPRELDEFKAVAAHLSALGRALRTFGMPKSPEDEAISALVDLLEQVRSDVDSARRASADVVRRNLQSWESVHA